MDFGSIMPVLSSEIVNNDTNSINNVKNSPEKAGQAFEALFYQQILSAMTKSIGDSEENKVNQMQHEWSWALLVQNIATEMAKENHLNIGELLNSSSEATGIEPGKKR